MSDAKGQSIRIIKSDNYGSELKVMMQQDYDIETYMSSLKESCSGNKISKSFGKKEYDSERKASDYAHKINSKLDFVEEAVKVVEKEVKVEYFGNVCR